MKSRPNTVPAVLAVAMLACGAAAQAPGISQCEGGAVGPACSPVPGSLDDGYLEIHMLDKAVLAWLPDPPYPRFNFYRAGLEGLRSDGLYTAPPGLPGAERSCHFAEAHVATETDTTEPAPGEAVLFLITGDADGVEQGLGTDSDGASRPHANPCPTDPEPLLIQIETDKTTYAPGEEVEIRVRFTNTSATDSLTYHFSSGCDVQWKVEGFLGHPIWDHPSVCLFFPHDITFEPGASATAVTHWDQTHVHGEPVRVPGTYFVRGGFLLDDSPQGITAITIEP